MSYHNPVMLSECLDGLNINPEGVYVDVTYGGGGHSKAILDKLNKNGRLYAFDQDPDAWQNKIEDSRFKLIPENFTHLKKWLRLNKVTEVDGILADLGVSSYQLDAASRGFSFSKKGPLDMRMNPSKGVSVKEWLQNAEEVDISDALYKYGEVRESRKIAKRIVEQRDKKPFELTDDLASFVGPFFHPSRRTKETAKVFQAFRIEVNQELEVLEQFLEQTLGLLKPKGRLVVMSYHSLEDRMVKLYLKSGNVQGKVEEDFFGNKNHPFLLINKKIIEASEEEVSVNPRARSAKLRVAEKKEVDEKK